MKVPLQDIQKEEGKGLLTDNRPSQSNLLMAAATMKDLGRLPGRHAATPAVRMTQKKTRTSSGTTA